MNDLLKLINQISSCRHESYLNELLVEILDRIGVTSYIFATFLRDSNHRDSYRFLIGCDPNWYQLYSKNKWYDIDPCIIYSRKFIKPLLLSELNRVSSEQLKVINHLEECGFKSGYIFPLHAAFGNRISVFLTGNSFDRDVGEQKLIDYKFVLRGISNELLEWWIANFQSGTVNYPSLVSKLTDQELILLRMEYDDFTSAEIAEKVGLTVSQVNNRFRSINALFSVDSKKEASMLAMEYGIITPY